MNSIGDVLTMALFGAITFAIYGKLSDILNELKDGRRR